MQYDVLQEPFETDLHRKLRDILEGIPTFSRTINRSLEASSELGSWCADVYWTFALSENEARKKEMKMHHQFHGRNTDGPTAQLDKDVRRVREAVDLVHIQQIQPPKADTQQLSSKVIELQKLLAWHFERPSDTRCIVFVEKRHIARLLKRLFEHIGTQHLKTGLLIGQTDRSGDENISVRQQVMTISKFRSGELNCLFATSIAEEGLDIPDCNVVIRFDLYKTMIQYIQSRGRARHRNSNYYHMMEKGNSFHVRAIIEARQAEDVMRTFCQSLPEDRKLKGNDGDLGDILTTGSGCLSYTEPETGAKLTYGSSLGILAHFAAALVGLGVCSVTEGSLTNLRSSLEKATTSQGRLSIS